MSLVISQECLDKLQETREIEAVFLANSLQQGFIYSALNHEGSDDAYIVQGVWQYQVSLDFIKLKEAWKFALKKYPSLRLRFSWEEELIQIVDKEGELDWRFVDLSETKDLLAQEIEIKKIQENDRKEPYELSGGKLFRVYLIKQKEDSYTCILSNHHSILDGWSIPILLNFVHDTYLRLKANETISNAVDPSYKEAQRYLQKHRFDSKEYWNKKLSTLKDKSDLSTLLATESKNIKLREYKHIIEPKHAVLHISSNKTRDLKQFSNQKNFTLNAILQFVWHQILRIYGGSEQTVVGFTVSGRDLPLDNIEQSVGLYINTLPLIVDHKNSQDKTVCEIIQKIQHNIQEAVAESSIHLASLQKGTERLFESVFIYENYPSLKQNELENTLKIQFRGAKEKIDYPLVVMAYEENEAIIFKLVYAAELFNSDTIDNVLSTIKQLLSQVVKKDILLKDLGLLSTNDYQKLIYSWNETAVNATYAKTIHELFEASADKFPDNIALIHEDKKLTFREFNEKSNELAHYLVSVCKVSPGSLIAFCLDRNEQLMIAILAILKAGCAYVPIDPEIPAIRLDYILKDTKTKVILTTELLKEKFETLEQKVFNNKELAIIALDASSTINKLKKQSKENPNSSCNPNTLAYVIYTSGTTGNPKGVMIEHHSYIETIEYIKNTYFKVPNPINTFSVTNVVFDIFGLEYGLPISSGGALTLGTYEFEDLDCRSYDFMQMTPSLCALKLDSLMNTQKTQFFVGGENLTANLLNKILDKFKVVINFYGPTETTIWSTGKRYTELDKGMHRVSLGTPLGNEKVYVLDENLRPLPIDAPGELYIGGVGLARGYLNQHELTNEKFILNPFQSETERLENINTRIYRTGDLVKWLPNGELAYIGRNDFQVKISGHRIELEEIEKAILNYPGIKKVAVIAKERTSDNHKFLIGYYVSEENVENEALKQFLNNKLPGYMVPAFLIPLDSLPLNASGKLDRKSLPEPIFTTADFITVLQDEQPRTELENQLWLVWQEILGIKSEEIGIRTNFFQLGGNSILAIKLASTLKKKFKKDIVVATIFEHNTIEKLACLIGEHPLKEDDSILIPMIEKPTQQLLSFAQERLWFLERYEEGSQAYNIPLVLELAKEIRQDVLEQSLKSIIQRHEVLRTLIKEDDDYNVYQQPCEIKGNRFTIERAMVNDHQDLNKNLELQFNHHFNLCSEYPIKICLYEMNCSNHHGMKFILGIVIHHIAFDGWSIEIFLKELQAFYEYYLKKSQGITSNIDLPNLPFQYKDFALWQRSYFNEARLQNQLKYWKDKLEGFQTLNLITDKDRPIETDYLGSDIYFKLNVDVSNGLRDLAKELQVSLYSVLLAGYALMLRAYTQQEDIVLGTPVANRHYNEVQNLIGLFVNSLVLRVHVTENDTLKQYIQKISQEVIGAQLNQDLPFERLVKAINPPKDRSRHPIFQVCFGVQGFVGGIEEENGEESLFKGTRLFKFYNTKQNLYNIAKFDVTTIMDDTDLCLKGVMNYAVSLFHETTIRHFIETYSNILSLLAGFSKTSLQQINVKLRDLNCLNEDLNNKIITQVNHGRETELKLNKRANDAASESAIEQEIQSIWAEVLRIPKDSITMMDSFFSLGGDSMLALRLTGKLNSRFQSCVRVKDIFEAQCIAKISEKILSKEKEAGLTKVSYKPFSLVSIKDYKESIDESLIEDVYPASFLQSGMLLESALDEKGTYHDIFGYSILAKFDKDKCQSIWNNLIEKHELLRASFVSHDENGFNVLIYQKIELDCLVMHDKDLTLLIEQEKLRHFDYTKPGLWRLIVNEREDCFDIVLSFHHAIADGWSIASLIHEFVQSYVYGKLEILNKSNLRYGAFIQKEIFSLNNKTTQTFWKQYLQDMNYVKADWKFDEKSSNNSLYNASFDIGGSEAKIIHELSKGLGVSPDIIFMDAYIKTLAYFTKSQDITIGLVTSNRPEEERGDQLFGLFLNTIPLRVLLNQNEKIDVELKSLFENRILIQKHQDLPYGYIKSLFTEDLYDFVFDFVHFHVLSDSIEKLKFKANFERTNIPFILTVSQIEDSRFIVKVTAHDDYVSEGYLNYFLDYYRQSLTAITTNDSDNTHSLMQIDYDKIIYAFNNTKTLYPNQTIVDLFEIQATKTPNAIAAIFGDKKITYQELNSKANQLAHYLQTLGTTPETYLGLFINRSIEMLIGMLGILKSGSVYVPLDPNYPEDRLQYILDDTGTTFLLTNSSLNCKFKLGDRQIIYLDTFWSDIKRMTASNPVSRLKPGNAAYVNYTSGSTGRPKGVVNTHEGIANRVLWTLETYPISEKDSMLYIATVGFDIALWEMIFPLMVGAKLIIAADSLNKDPDHILNLIDKWKISVIHFVPSLLDLILEHPAFYKFQSIKQVVCGGEGISFRLKEKFIQKLNAELYHAYGPTEAAISVTHWNCREDIEQKRVPIGKPIDNTGIYIVDTEFAPVPLGVPGEICIGGVQLARGYHNNPDLTAEKFIPNPYLLKTDSLDHHQLRLYRTGDLGRYLPDGNIEFLGRADEQVKIRGFRIELKEIESNIKLHPRVAQVLVLAREDQPGDKKLVAYIVQAKDAGLEVVSEETLLEELRNQLERKLPDFMIPSFFIFIDKIPLTPNGKVDRKSLPAPDITQITKAEKFVAPRNEHEIKLCLIWQDVLKIEPIGIQDNFFKLGGHSLLAIQAVSRIRHQFGIDIPLRALFDCPTVASITETVLHLLDTKVLSSIPAITPQFREHGIPLSFAQARLWFLDQLLPESSLYNMPLTLRVEGKLNINALEQAFNVLIQRHEALRTIFLIRDGQTVQVILEGLEVELKKSIYNLSNLSGKEKQRKIEGITLNEAKQVFNLSSGPLFRIKLLKLSKSEHILLITLHHIVSDGWSMDIFFRELTFLYETFAQGRKSLLPELTIQYADFAIWQHRYIQGKILENQLQYWKQNLAGIPDYLDLPTDKVRPKDLSYDGASYHFKISKEVKEKLSSLAIEKQVSLFMLLLASFQILLYRLSGQKDIVVGAPVASRHYKETENLIGFFVNTMALRTQFLNQDSFNEVLERIKETVLEAQHNQDVPFEQLVESLNVNRDLNRNPIFQIMFNYLKTPKKEIVKAAEITISPMPSFYPMAKFDLSLTAFESVNELTIAFEYMTELFEARTIEKMANHFEIIIEEFIKDPKQSITEFPLLTSEEWQEIVIDLNETQDNSYPTKSLPELFEVAVLKSPTAPAIQYQEEILNFEALHQKTNQLAHYLRRQGIGKEALVAISLNRSIDMVIGLLGILKAGGAYVPIDPDYPIERIRTILQDSEAAFLLTQSEHASKFKDYRGRVVQIDSESKKIELESNKTPKQFINPDQLACVIYTSGSTGKPKGVMLHHQLIVNRFDWMWKRYPFVSNEISCQKTSLSFVDAVWEIFGPLLQGIKLVLVPKMLVNDPPLFVKYLSTESITRLVLVPALLQTILDLDPKQLSANLSKLRICVVSGEALPLSTSLKFQETLLNKTKLLNLYGSTEIGADATYYEISQDNLDKITDNRVSIGKPISNLKVYILDTALNPVPIGVCGEIYVTGLGLARGYWDNSDITAEKFIPNPFITKKEALNSTNLRLYRTGDFARFLPDGNIEYLGRLDNQVKIRGFRIELGEIESILKTHSKIDKVLVVASAQENSFELTDKKLAAYIVLKEPFIEPFIKDKECLDARGEAFYTIKGDNISVMNEEFRSHLSSKLPDYMVPTYFIYLDKLPLTPSGKIDRRSLPALDLSLHQVNQEYLAPRSHIEQKIVTIWEEILKRESIGVKDNFFKLGGHSLLATQVVSRIRQQFSIEIPLKALFEFPTIEGLGFVVEELVSTQLPENTEPHLAILPQPRNLDIPLSFAQARLWFLDQLIPNSAIYNLSLALRIRGPMQISMFEKALNAIILRHESLRTIFSDTGTDPIQVVLPEVTISLASLSKDLSSLSREAMDITIKELVKEEALTPFTLSIGPLIRARLLILPDQEYILLLTLHHIITDGWSMDIFFVELSIFYNAYLEGKEPKLSLLPIQYADYSIWQRQWLQGDVLTRQLNYWKEKLDGIPALLELPTDKKRPKELTYEGGSLEFHIESQLKEALDELARQNEATLFMTLLAAFQILLFRYTGQNDIVVGSPIANRHLKETEPLIGFFVNTLSLRTTLSGSESFIEILKQVKETTLEAYQYQDVYFDQLVDYLDIPRALNHNPIFQVEFSIRTLSQHKDWTFKNLKVEGLPLENSFAKFDLRLLAIETEAGLSICIDYSKELFVEDTVKKFGDHFKELLNNVCKDPRQTITLIPFLTGLELNDILYNWNATTVKYPKFEGVYELFEKQAKLTPDHIALQYRDAKLTYLQLNENANQFAHFLRHIGVGRDTFVAVALDRSLEVIITILGILKAGGAYVPLDIHYPQDRLQFILEDSHAPIVITDLNIVDKLPATFAQVICLEEIIGSVDTFPTHNLENFISPQHTAYVIYTSGSTGKPKGVMVTQEGISNLVKAQCDIFNVNQDTKTLQFSSFAFDASVSEIFTTITKGGRLFLVDKEVILDKSLFAQFMNNNQINLMTFPPSYLQDLSETDFPNLRTIVIAGEAPNENTMMSWSKNRKLINAYGPTEASICSSYFIYEREASPHIIGCPISNVQIYILDRYLNPVPAGVIGEMYLTGLGLARGYLNRSDLTAEKFIPNPFITVDADDDHKNTHHLRLYQTGDLARLLPDGKIEFVGRRDSQVKIRGFRIEIGEIESTLRTHGSIQQVLVVTREDESLDKKLIAYVVPEEEQRLLLTPEIQLMSSSQSPFSILMGETIPALTEDLRNHLGRFVPDYMIPSFFVFIDQIPLTPNGKIDNKSLPAPLLTQRTLEETYIAPSNDIEVTLLKIWQEILKIEQIGMQDNFFKLGGHSLLATQVISRIRHFFGIDIPLRTLFEESTIQALGLVVQKLMNEKDKDLLVIPLITPQTRGTYIPLSYAQSRLWFIDQLLPNSPLYNVPLALHLKGELDVTALEKAFNKLIERHESLRTIFEIQNGKTVQVILQELTISLPTKLEDITFISDKGKNLTIQKYIFEETQIPFNLSKGPLIRVQLQRLSSQEYVLLVTMHHIISDGWSMGIFFKELSALYNGYMRGTGIQLPPLAIQYADFALWQRQWIQGEKLEKQLQYWKETLSGIPDLLLLPTDKPRPKELSYRAAGYSTLLSNDIKESLNQLASETETSLFMVVLAAFQVLLHRYSGQKDVVVGFPIANRHYKETEDLIGFFVNTLAFRTTFVGNESFVDILNIIKRTTLQAYQHQDVYFDQLIEYLNIPRVLNRNPIFQVEFTFTNEEENLLHLSNIEINPIPIDYSLIKFDLCFHTYENKEGIGITIGYATDLFVEKTIVAFAQHFKELLVNIIKDPNQKLNSFDILTQQEKNKIIKEWNTTKVDFKEVQLDETHSVPKLFEKQAAKSPNDIAVIFEDQTITFKGLNEKANQLANYLKSIGIGPETLIAVSVEKSLRMIIALLGILKAGGAYVPLDPSYPKERLQYILEDTGAAIILTDSNSIDLLPATWARLICLDEEWEEMSSFTSANPINVNLSHHLAYIIYTSGSTGKPKGVMINHASFLNHMLWMKKEYQFSTDDVILQRTAYSFDASVWEIFMPLICGSKMVIPPQQSSRDFVEFYNILVKHQVTAIQLVPSLLLTLLNVIPANKLPDSLRHIFVGGESFSTDLCRSIFEKSTATVTNLYGPTETTIESIVFKCNSSQDLLSLKTVMIGQPISNLQAYILDEALNPVPIGVPGEIYIAGAGLARGYFNQPLMTAERFIPNPFIAEDMASEFTNLRLYRTGDLGRYLPNGNIECLGRLDEQVKIRGFRIELGEIESRLRAHPEVLKTVVMVREDNSNDKQLVAYIVPNESWLNKPLQTTQLSSSSGVVFNVLSGEEVSSLTEDLRNHLISFLPNYMIPNFFVLIDQIPLMPNGKMDQKSLPAPNIVLTMDSTYVAPRNDIEHELCLIWKEILKVERVGIHDNFFKLGGHSLLATQVVSRIRYRYGIDLPLREIFEQPNIETLALVIDTMVKEENKDQTQVSLKSITPEARGEIIPVSFAQARLWFLDQLLPEVALYNMPLAIKVEGQLDLKALEEAFNALIARHESLRTHFSFVNGQPVQVIVPIFKLSLDSLTQDLSQLPGVEISAVLEEISLTEASARFDLSTGPLFRVKLLKLLKEEHVLLITLHHIISDGWSMNIFFKELMALYNVYSEGSEPQFQLPSLPIQYPDFALWQHKHIHGEILEKQLQFWKTELLEIPELLDLPTDKPRPKELSYRGESYHCNFNKDVKQKLNEIATAHQATLFMVFLAAFQVLLYRLSGQKDIVVGAPNAGRHYKETENLIGFFVNTLALRTQFVGLESFAEVLTRIRNTTLEANQYQDVPFEQLVDLLKVNRDLNRNPIFQVMFNFLKASKEDRESTQKIKMSLMGSSYPIAKFDLTLNVYESEEGIAWGFEYMTDLFERSTIERMASHFELIVQEVMRDPNQGITEFSLLTEVERQEIVYQINDTEVDYKYTEYTENQTLSKMFEATVQKNPKGIAIQYQDKHLSFAELNQKANQLAHYLRKQTVGNEILVAISIDRSLEMIVSLLAVLKTGGAYLPIDPGYPIDRIQFMLEDSRTSFLITESKYRDKFNKYTGRMIFIDSDLSKIQGESEENPKVNILPKNLACVIYTSGSTGRPKGVLLDHGLILNRFVWMWEKYPFNEGEICCQKTSLSFVDAVWEIFGPLLKGIKLVLVPISTVNDPREFIRYLAKQSISRIVLVPSLLQTLVEQDPKLLSELKNLRICVVSGEALPSSTSVLFQKTLIQYTKLLNLYGSTEIGADATYHELYQVVLNSGLDLEQKNSIGKPISNLEVYILDEFLNPVPKGVLGEIYVGGMGLARGYLYQAPLTAEKFIPNPFITEKKFKEGKNLRLYRTGDLGRFLSNGNIEYLGRVDNQVKIRGFRIELGEIESVLKTNKEISQGVIIAKQGVTPNANQLVAYCVPSDNMIPTLSSQLNLKGNNGQSFSVMQGEGLTLLTQSLKDTLNRSLPDYMMPSSFVYLNKIPLLSNGKIDRKTLAGVSVVQPKDQSMTMLPKSELQQKLSQLWGEVINSDTFFNIEDNFFDVGGNSLLTIRLRDLIEKAFDIPNLPVSKLFKYPSIKTFSEYLIEKETTYVSTYSFNVKDKQKKELDTDIAVIAISGAFPKANDVEELWQNLLNGYECLDNLSLEECKKIGVPESVVYDQNYVPVGAKIEDMDTFDPAFWKISENEALLMDPQVKKFLEHSWMVLEKSGYIRERESQSIGVFVGMSESQYSETRIKGNKNLPKTLEPQFMNGKDFFATKISYMLGLTGPALNINTACSTSLVAIVEACKNLALGSCDMAIAGGVSFQMPEYHGYIYYPDMIFSKSGHCRVFDENSSGTVFGAALGVVALKRLKDAIQDKDNIIAVVKGYAINNDGNRKVGFTAPSVIGQTDCIMSALNMAEMSGDTIGYVECHGTGTALGDPIEINALQDAFRSTAKNNTQGQCILGALKANIGHADSAAGVAGFMKVCKMLQSKIIPPQINFNAPNPELNLEKTNFRITTKMEEWTSRDYPRRAGVSAFGIGGTNAHVILEEYNQLNITKTASNPRLEGNFYILPISAKSTPSFRAYVKALIQYFAVYPEVSLADVAYTLQFKREFFQYRGVVVARSKDEVIEQLKNLTPVESKHLSSSVMAMFQNQEAAYAEMAAGNTLQFYISMGDLWTLGFPLDWKKIETLTQDAKSDRSTLKIADIPSYQFQKKHCSLDLPPRKDSPIEEGYTIDKTQAFVHQAEIEQKTVLLEEGEVTDFEKQLAEIFCEILGSDRISKYQSFFELGGDSLSAIKMINQINKIWEVTLNLSQFYSYDNVEKLAKYLSNGSLNKTKGREVMIEEGEI